MSQALFALDAARAAMAAKSPRAFAAPVGAAAAVVEDERLVWDLSALYADPDTWQDAHAALRDQLPEIEAFKGSLGQSAQTLRMALDRISDFSRHAVRLLVYATLKADEDTRIATHEERRQLSQKLLADFGQAVSWFDPEVLQVGAARIHAFLAEDAGLAKHRFGLENTLRAAPHTLGAEAENVLAGTAVMSGAPGTIYNILSNAELPWPKVALSDGTEVELDQSAYARYRQAPQRQDRQAVFDAFWGAWSGYASTFGTVLNSHVQAQLFQARSRNHPSTLQRALFPENMPEAVYRTLIAQVNDALPTLHRYFRLRARMLGLPDAMRYFDIYPPLVSLEAPFPIETSVQLTREALSPLGPDYLEAYDHGVKGGWMHVLPREGKRAGAYMFGSAYDVHPYVLLNHNDDYDSMSTFAHEYGHAVHTLLTNGAQPWELSDYSTFVAETASIMNEMLLQDHMVAGARTREEKLFYLGHGLEALRGTYFRQTMFAEFELAMHEMAGAGEILTGEKLTQTYLDLLKRYHGHNEGVMTIDEAYAVEWAYVPHFYYGFYVYQYATSIAAASALAGPIAQGQTAVRDAFITMLKAGGSDYPYDLMMRAGVDLAAPEPYKALEVRMNAIMDQMEDLLAG